MLSNHHPTTAPVPGEANSIVATPLTPSQGHDEIIRISAAELLSAYQKDEEAAKERFTDRRVELTGTLTGVFVPSLEVSMRVAANGGSADAFVTMGGRRPESVRETLFLPGIHAFSEGSSLFGQHSMDMVSDKLVPGRTVTMLCTVRSSGRVSDLVIKQHSDEFDYSIDLDGCSLSADGNVASPEHDEGAESAEKTDVNADSYTPGTPLTIHPDTSSNASSTFSDGSVGAIKVFKVGGNITPPVVVRAVEAEFSDDARREKYQGECLVSLIVDAHGNPQNPVVIRGLRDGLNEKALEAVRGYRFRPGLKDGTTPVATRVTIAVNFRLY